MREAAAAAAAEQSLWERLALPQTAGGPEVNAADDLRLGSSEGSGRPEP